ncbi:MAG: biotin/lipoyl-binding protein, partial [Betaproteobacteria bacterium]
APRLSQVQRWISWALVAGLLAFVAWAALAPIGEGVPTQAVVAIDTKRKTIQHLQGGIIREVLVREGDQVKEGQVLLRLEDGVVKANLEAVRKRYLGLRAMESRLVAEQVDRDRIEFHPDVLAEAKDPLIQRHVATQEQLWRTRRSALQADLAAIEESIRGQEAMRQSYAGMIESRRSQQRLLQEQLSNIRGLV